MDDLGSGLLDPALLGIGPDQDSLFNFLLKSEFDGSLMGPLCMVHAL